MKCVDCESERVVKNGKKRLKTGEEIQKFGSFGLEVLKY
jgi:hypothetical protein